MTQLANNYPTKRGHLNPWFNCREAAAHCGLSEKTIRNAVYQREMTVRRSTDRGPFYIRLGDLETWFKNRFRNVSPAIT